MITLRTREEIARAINFKQYPVVVIDLAQTDSYGIVGARVCIDNGKHSDGLPYYIKATLRAFNDDKKLVFQAYGAYLSNSFCYSDMEEMLNYANVPIIKKDQDIVICLINSAMRISYCPVILHTGKRVNPHCQTPLGLEAFEITV